MVISRRGDGDVLVYASARTAHARDVLAYLKIYGRRAVAGLKGLRVIPVLGSPLRDVPGTLFGSTGLNGLLDIDLRHLMLRFWLRTVGHVGKNSVRVDNRSARARLPDDADGLMRSVGLRPVP